MESAQNTSLDMFWDIGIFFFSSRLTILLIMNVNIIAYTTTGWQDDTTTQMHDCCLGLLEWWGVTSQSCDPVDRCCRHVDRPHRNHTASTRSLQPAPDTSDLSTTWVFFFFSFRVSYINWCFIYCIFYFFLFVFFLYPKGHMVTSIFQSRHVTCCVILMCCSPMQSQQQ